MTSAVELGGTPSDALICGTAVTTIVPSRISMKKHAATSKATLRRRLSIIERAAKHAGNTAVMTFIETVPEGDALGELTQMYEADRESFGHVRNLTRAFSHRPDVYAAWAELNGAIKANMDLRRYELATVAAARRLRSSYCTLAHGSVLMDRFVAPEELAAIVSDHRAAGLEPVDVAVMDLADKVAQDATSVAQADIDALRAHGLSDAEIFDVIAAAAARCFFSKVLDAVGAQPDATYAELDAPLRETLTVGRPIAEA
jgi:uncharacterized peroxidase-related enzyme